MAKTSRTSYHFPTNKNIEPEFSIYNGFDREFAISYEPERRRPYYCSGKTFGEGSLIWLPIIYHGEDFGCNIDPGDTGFDSNFKISLSQGLKQAVMLSLASDSYSIPTSFMDYFKAQKLASKKKEPGFVIACHDGEFQVLCESFYDPDYDNVDYVAKVFNAELCHLENRTYWASLLAQINDAHVLIGIRYAKNKELNWERAAGVVKTEKYYGDDDWGYDDIFSYKLDDSNDDDNDKDDDDDDEDTDE